VTNQERFAEIFQLPPAMRPYIDLVADEREIDLVLALAGVPMTAAEITDTLRLPPAEIAALLATAFSRQIINRQSENGTITYAPATFYERLSPMAMYDRWGNVPAEARDAVIEWDLQEFIAKFLPVIEELRQDPDAYTRIPNRDVLLLDEALAQVEAAAEHVVVPCDCRAITMACNSPQETCIRLDEGARMTLEHGHGRRLTREECKALVVDADRAGLMHTGLRAWQGHELFGFCNCCACCCFPIRAGTRLGIQRQWPHSHHVARRDPDACLLCGLCADRCHFGAFFFQENGDLSFDQEKCWGCGICATGCTEAAITMEPLRPGGTA
jgi:Pyruvate/2-oxoacid:ferredoxin oxidoreductase delta subunit